MKRKWHIAAAALALTAVTAWADSPLPVTVSYDAAPAGAGPWQYTYTVENTSLGQLVSEFTIWFAHDAYRNVALATPDPPVSAWNELVIQPDPLLSDDGYYDVLSLLGGIPEGGLVSGFAVTFDWLGPGTPGAQAFDIIDSVTYWPIYSGATVPEPATAGLLGLSAAVLLRRRV